MKPYTLTPEDVSLLRRMYARHGIATCGIVNAVYVTPAQRLRNAADEMEAEERDWSLFKELIAKI